MHMKIPSTKWWPFCSRGDELIQDIDNVNKAMGKKFNTGARINGEAFVILNTKSYISYIHIYIIWTLRSIPVAF